MLDCNQTCNHPVTDRRGDPSVVSSRYPDWSASDSLAIEPAEPRLRPLPTRPTTLSPGETMADYVTRHLEHAGRTVLSLPRSGYTTALQTSSLDVVRVIAESYGWSQEQVRPSRPTNRAISLMDEAYAWLGFIPDSHYATRRIVGARSLVNPMTDTHLYSWRKLGNTLGKHHDWVKVRHAEGLGFIVAGLVRVGFFK